MVFDYTNGFHDAANAIATSVSTRALTPRIALIVAAFGNLVGSYFGKGVAETVGKDLVTLPVGRASLSVVFAGVIGAIAWNLITWYFGLPSSSTHALLGGLRGEGRDPDGGLAAGRVPARVPDDAGRLMGLPPRPPGRAEPPVPPGPGGLRDRHGVRARHAGRRQDDGHRRPGPLHRGVPGQQDAHPVVGLPDLRHGAGARHLLGRLADHPYPRPPRDPPGPGRGVLGGDGRQRRPVLQLAGPARADLHHPHDHLGHHGGGGNQAVVRGALGRRGQHRRRLGDDLPGRGGDRDRRVLPRTPALRSVSLFNLAPHREAMLLRLKRFSRRSRRSAAAPRRGCASPRACRHGAPAGSRPARRAGTGAPRPPRSGTPDRETVSRCARRGPRLDAARAP